MRLSQVLRSEFGPIDPSIDLPLEWKVRRTRH